MKNIKEFIIPTVTLFAICLVAAALLGLTNSVTAPKIAALAVETEQNAKREVLPGAVTFSENKTDEVTGCTYSEAYDEGNNVIGYAVTASGKGGYGGEIVLMVGINADGSVAEVINDDKSVAAISFLEEAETPSIGGKLKKNIDFLRQFIGKSGSAALTKNGGEIAAVSGATKTSVGVTDAVNNALKCYESVKGEVSVNG